MDLALLSNPLATIEQLSSSASQFDGISPELERSVRFAGVQLTEAAGILLRLPQEIIAQAIIVFSRFYIGPEGGSLVVNSAKVVFQTISLIELLLIERAGRFRSLSIHDCQALRLSPNPTIHP